MYSSCMAKSKTEYAIHFLDNKLSEVNEKYKKIYKKSNSYQFHFGQMRSVCD